MKKLKIGIIVLVLVIIAGVGYKLYFYFSWKTTYTKLAQEIISEVDIFPGEAGLYIKDLRTGLIIGYNEDKTFPSASLVKIPIMAAVFQAVKDGRLKLDDEVPLKRKYIVGGSGKLKRYRWAKKFKISELVELMITESDNTATNMLTGILGLDGINELFKSKFGLKQTDLKRGIMDLRKRKKGIENYTTAKEMGILLERIYRKKMVSKEYSEKMLNILMHQKSNDRIPRFLPSDLVVAHKTGFLRDVCHDTGIVFTDKGNFIVCVLTDEIRNYRLAKNFIGNIAYKTYQRY